jgi:hypothetical protein
VGRVQPELLAQATAMRTPQVRVAEVDGLVAMLSVKLGKLYYLDEIGSHVWQLLEEPCPVPRLCDTLADHYGAEPAEIEHDLLVFLQTLAERGLIRLTHELG